MTVRPILFSGPMVRALLDGRKSQTRRVMKPQPTNVANCDRIEWHTKSGWCEASEDQFARLIMEDLAHLLPYAVGDLLWVREAWRVDARFDSYKPRELPRTAHPNLDYLATAKPDDFGLAGKTRASFFMLRWASRLTLRVTEVRVQRLREISEEDAKAEGAPFDTEACDHKRHTCDEIGCSGPGYRGGFATLWDSLNAKRDGGAFSWASNPWVVAVSFEVIRANVNQVVEASDG
jgi:hypothetical protein